MRNKFSFMILSLFLLLLPFQPVAAQNNSREFSFIVSSDQREHATEKYRSHEYTMGGYEAIKKAGRGSFMVILGDLDPPQATYELIDKVLGKDYRRYPVVGNHDIEKPENIEYLRSLNRAEKSLPNLTSKGPAGSEETTYSFDFGSAHFIILNLYYDGKTDNAMDGNVTPELMAWLENDLRMNRKKHVFVFGHEPLFPVLDMETGTVRHVGDALDKYPDNTLKFEQLLLKHKVTAYVSGHVHCASYSCINGLWLLNSGHLYGQEGNHTAAKLIAQLAPFIEKEKSKGSTPQEAVKEFYNLQKNDMKKFFFNLGFGDGRTYKNLTDDRTLEYLNKFYSDCINGNSEVEKYEKLFWKNTEWRPSTFLKIKIGEKNGVLEIYRDKDYSGNYVLRHTQVLYK